MSPERRTAPGFPARSPGVFAERFGPPALVVVCTFALYLPALGFPFQWDDRLLLEREPAMADLGSLPEAVTSHYLELASARPDPTPYYRPASIAWLIVERVAFGTEPHLFRLVHISLHLVGALLLYATILALLREATPGGRRKTRWLSALGATFFAVLPYNADAVLLLTDIGNLLALCAMLCALCLFDRHRRTGRIAALLGAVAVYSVAVLAKEPALVLPVILVARHLLESNRALDRRAALGVASAGGVALAYLAVRFLLVGADLGDGRDAAGMPVSFPAAFAAVVRWTAAPHPLSLVEPLDLPGTWLTVSAGAAGAVLAIAGAVVFRRRLPALSLALVAFLLFALPVSVAIVNEGALAPRWLYLSGAAYAVGVTVVLAALPRVAIVALAGLVLSAGLLAGIRVAAWRSEIALWSAETDSHPELAHNLINLGLAHERLGDLEEALRLQLRAVELAERDGKRDMLRSLAHLNTARLLARSPGSEDRALGHFRRAAEANPRSPDPWSGAGNIHARDGEWRQALAAYEQAVKRAPRAVSPLIGRAGALAALGDHAAALADLDRALELAAGTQPLTGRIAARRRLVEDMRKQAHDPGSPSAPGSTDGRTAGVPQR